MIRATVVTRGGHRLRAHIRKVSRRSPTSLEVGFFDDKKYPDGTYVAQVAVYNNYGTGNIPARPFFDEFADGSTETLREHSARTPPITNAERVSQLLQFPLVLQALRTRGVRYIRRANSVYVSQYE